MSEENVIIAFVVSIGGFLLLVIIIIIIWRVVKKRKDEETGVIELGSADRASWGSYQTEVTEAESTRTSIRIDENDN
jgi:putative exporter of polyketide antibiotics